MQDILHVAEVLKGGTSSYLEEILPFQASLFGPSHVRVLIPKSQVSDLPSSKALQTTEFNDKGSRIANIIKLITAVRKLVSERRPTIIHAHGTFAGVAVRLALCAMRNRPPIIYCSHGWAFDREGSAWKNNVIAQIEKFLAPLADKIVCISEHDRQSALQRGFNPAKLVVVLNGIRDIKLENTSSITWPTAKRRILFAGRFDRQKGVDIFIEAMRKIGSDYHAFAIGAASVGDEFLTTSIPDNVTLTGWIPREKVQEYLSSAEIFVMPSRWEGFGLSALEAMRAGVAVIASRVGGLSELVDHQKSGILINPNSVDALVTAIKSMSSEEIHLMGQASQKRFQKLFMSDKMNADLVRIYKDARKSQ